VIITGGASGIGASFVRAFVENGAKVAFLDLQREAGAALANSLGEGAARPLFLPCDLTDTSALRTALGEISYRLFVNFGAALEFARYLKNIRRPAPVLVGSADEQVIADQFAPVSQSLGVNIPVTIVPGMTHVDMIATPTALKAVVNAVGQQK
jgi:NAD(P)-dependent dehydrogenase (short-subunit alcohol dehydrogenase family)